MKNILLCLINCLLMTSAQVTLKHGMNGQTVGSLGELIRIFFTPLILSGLFLYGLSFLLWLYLLSILPLSTAYPIMALAYPLVMILSLFFFKEDISAIRWAGIGCICLGVFLVAR